MQVSVLLHEGIQLRDSRIVLARPVPPSTSTPLGHVRHMLSHDDSEEEQLDFPVAAIPTAEFFCHPDQRGSNLNSDRRVIQPGMVRSTVELIPKYSSQTK